jgi:hypothetical protein
MEDTRVSPDGRDGAQEPGTGGPEKNCGQLVRDLRDRIEADLLEENILQRHIINMMQSAGTGNGPPVTE